MIASPVIRPAQIEDARAIARVHIDTWRTTYVGIVPDEHLANLSYPHCEARWIENLSNPKDERTVVVEDQTGQVVGFSSGGPVREALDNFDGELYGLYVLKPFQGLGYGRQLVTTVARDLAGRGFTAMVLWALKDNPACRFYEKLGGRRVGEKVVKIGGKQLLDAAFGWPDLTVFG